MALSAKLRYYSIRDPELRGPVGHRDDAQAASGTHAGGSGTYSDRVKQATSEVVISKSDADAEEALLRPRPVQM